LLDALLSTLWLTLLGAILGLAAGTLLAVACWWFCPARPMIITPAVLAQVVPIVVFIPILGRLVGFGTPSVLAIAVISGFFPSLVFVDSGLSSVSRARKELAQLLGASRFRYLLHVALPTSIPRFTIAIRLTASSAFLGTVTADYLVGSNGLGRLMADTQFFLGTSRSWAIAAVVIAMSIGAYSCAGWLERWAHDRFEVGGT
jgi:ABC-type nitrate/sulfonate/bicarbonate transport system permease component